MATLESLAKELEELSGIIKDKKELSKFLKKQGGKLKNKTVSVAESKVGTKIGNYINSIKNGKVYDFQGDLSTRVYSTAPHAHLIEYGHNIVGRNGSTHGFQDGEYVFEDAVDQFKDKFHKNTEEFINQTIDKIVE